MHQNNIATNNNNIGLSFPPHPITPFPSPPNPRNLSFDGPGAFSSSEDPTEELAKRESEAISDILNNREEIIRAFIAKYGFGPGETIQIVQQAPDGSLQWQVTRRAKISKDEARDLLVDTIDRLDVIEEVQDFCDEHPGLVDGEEKERHRAEILTEVRDRLVSLVGALGA